MLDIQHDQPGNIEAPAQGCMIRQINVGMTAWPTFNFHYYFRIRIDIQNVDLDPSSQFLVYIKNNKPARIIFLEESHHPTLYYCSEEFVIFLDSLRYFRLVLEKPGSRSAWEFRLDPDPYETDVDPNTNFNSESLLSELATFSSNVFLLRSTSNFKIFFKTVPCKQIFNFYSFFDSHKYRTDINGKGTWHNGLKLIFLDSSRLGYGTPAINYFLTLPLIPTILNMSVLSRLTPKPNSWIRAQNFLWFAQIRFSDLHITPTGGREPFATFQKGLKGLRKSGKYAKDKSD